MRPLVKLRASDYIEDWGLTMRRWWLGVAVGLLVLAGGCGFFREEKTVVVAQQTQPSTFDPHLANETVVYSTLSNVVEGLVRFSPYLQLEPALAVRWQQESPTAVRFWLRQGVVFHNGQELTARDVVASVLRARDHPKSQLKHLVRDVVEVKADEPLSVVIRTSTPAPTLLKRLVFVAVVPEAQAQEREILVPIGTGPYRIVRREGTTLEMRAVPWWGGMPQIKKARFLFEENDQHRTSLFLAKKVDVCAWLRKEDVAEAARQKDLRVVQQPRLSVQMLALSPRAASGEAARALADVRVRRALLLALNRQRLVEEVARGDAVVASQLVHPLVFGYDPSLPPVPYDPEKARALLSEAGFASGFTVRLGAGRGAEDVVRIVQEDWEKVGVRVELEFLPFPEVLARARDGRLPVIFFARTCTTSDASEFLDPQTHSYDPARGWGQENYPRMADPEVDRLLEEASRELDEEKRRALLQQAQRRVLEQGYYLPLVIRWFYLGMPSWLQFQPRYDQFLFLPDFKMVASP